MRRLTLIAILPLAALGACSVDSGATDTPGVAGTGSGTTRSFSVAGFDAIDAAGSDDVDVRVGTGFSVRAEGPSEELDRLKIEKIGNALRIGRRNNSGFSWGGNRESLKIYVTMPRVAKASLAGSGNITIDRVEGESFTGESAGSGGIEVTTLNVQTGRFSIAGSGDVKLAGTAKKLTMEIAGSGDIDASGVKAEGASVSIAGSGSVRGDVTGTADVSIMGSGDVDLGKGAKCTTSKMGSGAVTCG